MPKQKRIAVIDRELCKPKVCNYLCQRVCPVNRSKEDCVTVSPEDRKPLIAEELCIGCGICCKKCPTQAITVVNLPERLENPIHRYGRNMFSLYKLPIPKRNAVVGLIGPNGVGKSTVLNILAGDLKPNTGLPGRSIPWDDIIQRFKGTELQDYMARLSKKDMKSAYKPQQVDMIPRIWNGLVFDLLKKADKTGRIAQVAKSLGIEEMMPKEISSLSGGELQLFAIAAVLLKDADFYFFDEPSSYLDVRERLLVAKEIRKLTEKAVVMVVEHDLAVADYMADYTHILYGRPGVFGIVSNPYGVRVGINTYLDGYIKEENMRFRSEPIIFSGRARVSEKNRLFLKFPGFGKSFKGFSLKTEPGELYKGEIIGILGPNATGKTTFIRMLAGEEKPDKGKSISGLKLAYKPQRLVLDKKEIKTVRRDFIKARSRRKSLGKEEKRIIRFLGLEKLLERKISRLSGGEMQASFIAAALLKESDLMLFDEPSAFLDVEQRLKVAKLLRDRAESMEIPCFVVDHDLQFLDAISDRVIVFEGLQGVKGKGNSPCSLKDGMNRFLKALDITFRRDKISGRPRANKPNSQKDMEQKSRGEYFYTG
jgi:ATP-binding cassette subfamily E protein 1